MNERLSLCMTPTRSRSRVIFLGANVPGSHREAYVCSFYRSRSLCGGGTEPCRRRKTYLCSFCRLAKSPPKFQFCRSLTSVLLRHATSSHVHPLIVPTE